jgi:hypothetical protein
MKSGVEPLWETSKMIIKENIEEEVAKRSLPPPRKDRHLLLD